MRLKFPVFEIINMAMTFTAFSPGMSTKAGIKRATSRGCNSVRDESLFDLS